MGTGAYIGKGMNSADLPGRPIAKAALGKTLGNGQNEGFDRP